MNYVVAAIAIAVLVVAWRLIAAWRNKSAASDLGAMDDMDTVLGWKPERTRVMTHHEREAYQTLVRALPDHMVLAQVPLARFLKVPQRRSYGEWMSRVGQLRGDLLVCDKASEVIAVVEVHSARGSARSRQRYVRMSRVLKDAGIRVFVWTEDAIPSTDAARAQILPEDETPTPSKPPLHGRLVTDLPVPETSDLGPDTEPMRDPAPSTWFDDFDATPSSGGPKS
jgi:hypothetical protein